MAPSITIALFEHSECSPAWYKPTPSRTWDYNRLLPRSYHSYSFFWALFALEFLGSAEIWMVDCAYKFVRSLKSTFELARHWLVLFCLLSIILITIVNFHIQRIILYLSLAQKISRMSLKFISSLVLAKCAQFFCFLEI